MQLYLAAYAALAGALVALAAYHFFVVGPALGHLRSAPLAQTSEPDRSGAAAAAQRLEGRISELEGLSQTDVSRIGFVRYDAFDDTGSDLSYALALLNRVGDGVVLSSIYSRTDTRTVGKGVEGFKPVANASEEELSAIARAGGATNQP
ncbi:MAG: DUF4446 family protein [Candidatus Eremiobacteraeota bacterium]|nr:DUF4446 family protein [Candidatus Eremiobacteraeota bacterium]